MERVFGGLLILLKPLLYPLSLIWGAVAWIRNRVYDKQIYNSIEFSIPVISVGNLSVGGTGKTPHIEYLIRLLNYEFKVAVMSRGYRRRSKGFRVAGYHDTASSIGDEPFQMFKKFPGTYITVAEDRMAGIPQLMSDRPDTEIVLLDDAFQHRSVKPGINILLMDIHRPFYEDYVLPFGRLREGRSGYKRADIIVVTKCPSDLSKQEQENIRAKIKPLPNQKVFFSEIKYRTVYDFYTGENIDLNKEQNLIMVSGIERPKLMLEYLRTKVNDVHLLSYPDHHYFSNADLEEMKSTVENWDESKNVAMIVSEKDAARLSLHFPKLFEWKLPLWVLPIEVEFLNNAVAFNQAVLAYIQNEREENLWMN